MVIFGLELRDHKLLFSQHSLKMKRSWASFVISNESFLLVEYSLDEYSPDKCSLGVYSLGEYHR